MSHIRTERLQAMKILPILAAAFIVFMPALASAADFGGEEAPPEEAFVTPIPPPVLLARPYNYVYEENGIYYAPPYPMPYFGLFPQWGPQVAFMPQPYCQPPPRPPHPPRRRW
ncbi:hypothetical protein [Hyphomicrobium sp. MC1]|uniref:hypothetical protein n=1 Tax=Hyphomicrobium sp. (strain MC1) TaxID=717785 RepID=UPI000213E18E|nr:hypothetical protein [Hyphomicrobium sp. MC1]CCB65198.1 exported protein of unknown function [Hyphomicrobium sp. MC1]